MTTKNTRKSATKSKRKSRSLALGTCSLSEAAMAELAAKVANDIGEDIDCRESRATLREVIRWWSLRSCIAHSELSLAKTDIIVGQLAVRHLLTLSKRSRSKLANVARPLADYFLKANGPDHQRAASAETK